ncbi:glycosyltransferase [Allokutzneria albata]|uniref:Alpha-1,6-mannosyltransferase n=1 Tax=Allokutzneria albata TaxID=211114 RepID=A0A1G9Z2M5_ALLAB|nr:glycosyltransferase [Allokutzneria albata]SDN15652.1 alpha-1,6-mannosyltransferase [Allokutzneria albata]
MRIVQLANFYGPRSGGLRTALNHLGPGYVARGHQVVLIVPGPEHSVDDLPGGVRRITLFGPTVPGMGGYRVLDPFRVRAWLDRLKPDAIEVSDRATLRGLGRWASRNGASSVVISHERLDRILEQFLLPPRAARWAADVANGWMARSFANVVCTTAFARQEFDRIGTVNLRQVPLGVDLDTFDPGNYDDSLHARLLGDADSLLVHCGRLSPEKHVERSVETVRELLRRGQRVRLVIAGDGPRRKALEELADGLPVTFLGFLDSRAAVADLLATADISLAPGPHETFGLAALEALASGTPVVVSGSSALPEIVRPGCGAVAADDNPAAFADAVASVLALPEPERRAAARARAECFPWAAAVDGMLDALR